MLARERGPIAPSAATSPSFKARRPSLSPGFLFSRVVRDDATRWGFVIRPRDGERRPAGSSLWARLVRAIYRGNEEARQRVSPGNYELEERMREDAQVLTFDEEAARISALGLKLVSTALALSLALSVCMYWFAFTGDERERDLIIFKVDRDSYKTVPCDFREQVFM